LLVSGGAGVARNRTNGSPTSHSCLRQYAHAVRSADNRTLNVVAALLSHTKVNHPLTRSGSRTSSATFVSAPKSATKRFNTMP
jgi:hypothetical protein